MNQKEYELIAGVFKGHLHSADTHTLKAHRTIERYALEGTIETMADILQRTYPKTFDRNKFLKACGV